MTEAERRLLAAVARAVLWALHIENDPMLASHLDLARALEAFDEERATQARLGAYIAREYPT